MEWAEQAGLDTARDERRGHFLSPETTNARTAWRAALAATPTPVAIEEGGGQDEEVSYQIQCRPKGSEFWHNMSGGEKPTLADALARIKGVEAEWVTFEYRVLKLTQVTSVVPAHDAR